MTVHTLGFFNLPGNSELIIILVIGLLLFGKRLPEVGRSLGKGIVEFKRGLKDINQEIETNSQPETSPPAVGQDASQPLPEGDQRRVAQPVGQPVGQPQAAAQPGGESGGQAQPVEQKVGDHPGSVEQGGPTGNG